MLGRCRRCVRHEVQVGSGKLQAKVVCPKLQVAPGALQLSPRWMIDRGGGQAKHSDSGHSPGRT